jgi:hypothetical protein
MKQDNSSYTVTSPDLMLTENGISLMIISNQKKLVDEVKLLVEKCITSSIIFYVQKTPTNEQSLPWLWYVSRTVDIMIVDLDTCQWTDILAATSKETGNVMFYSPKSKKLDAIRLLNVQAKYPILPDWEELEKAITKEFYGPTDNQ